VRVLIISWDGGGNIPPTLSLGRHLVGAGHEVVVLGTPTLAKRVAEAGLRFRALTADSTWVPRSGSAIEDDVATFAMHLAGVDLARDTLAAIETHAPTLLVVDCMAGGALCAGEASGLPTAVLVHMRYSYLATGAGVSSWARARPLFEVTRSELGLDPLAANASLWPSLWERAERTLVASVIELDPNLDVPSEVLHVGPITDPDPPDSTTADDLVQGNDHPLVLVSHSTTYMGQQDVLQRILDGLDGSDLRVVLTLGPNQDPDTLKIPSNARPYLWLDHRAVMARSSVVVTHGGLGTVLAALTAGVPMVCLPAGRDQIENAEIVAALGAGCTLSEASGPGQISEAVSDVLANPGYRKVAQEMAAAIGRYGCGPRAVAELSAIAGASGAK
jgi:UDP:flavonoid glycosyltransferase YjiC (YdhE family)